MLYIFNLFVLFFVFSYMLFSTFTIFRGEKKLISNLPSFRLHYKTKCNNSNIISVQFKYYLSIYEPNMINTSTVNGKTNTPASTYNLYMILKAE